MKKRLVSMLLVATLVGASLVGCGKNQSTNKTATEETGKTESTKENETGEKQSTFDVATVRWADWGEKYHEGFADDSAAEMGLTINWNTILNADGGDKKAVLMAGGELPDAFMGSICFTESDLSANRAAFIPLEDYIEKYMPNLSAIMKNDPTMKALATSADGHIYGLPSKKPCRPVVANQMFINQKWLDNLGLSMPQTYEEFYKVLKAFKEQDANGNGDPSDEVPFGQGYADTVMFFCLPFGTTIGADNTYEMTIKDGKPVYIPTSDEYKEGIAWMNKCYKEGLIDTEVFTQDTSMRDAKLMSETPLVGSAPGWTADATFGANSSEYVALPALAGPDGERYISSDPEHWNYSRNEFVVTTSCSDPATLLSWVDKFYTDDASIQNFYGSFGVGVNKDGENYTVLEPQNGDSADTYAWINSLRDFGPKYVEDGFNDRVKYEAANGDAIKIALDNELNHYAKEAYPNVSYTSEQLDKLATLYMDINSYVKTTQAKWVTEGGVETEWDSYIDTLKQMGYDEFIKIQQEAYDTYVSTK